MNWRKPQDRQAVEDLKNLCTRSKRENSQEEREWRELHSDETNGFYSSRDKVWDTLKFLTDEAMGMTSSKKKHSWRTVL